MNFENLEKLKLSPFTPESVVKIITQIPVRKPGSQDFFRAHPSPDFAIAVGLLQLKELGESYLVAPELQDELQSEIKHFNLITCMDKHERVFLFPLKLPDSFGKLDPWNTSATIAAQTAQSKWIRMTSNRSIGCYEVYAAAGELGEPKWPNMTFNEILKLAFKDYCIESVDHPVVKQLRGY